MNSKLLTAGILSIMLATGAISAVGSVTTAFAQSQDDSMISDNTTTASSNATRLSGVISSLQNNEAGAPAWITAGHWQLESDRTVFGSDEPHVSNFSALIYMASIANGTIFHPHEISDFRQTDVLHSSENVTTINGTFTISMSDGPHQNTSGYIALQNHKISIWVDPTGIDEHFGPTPIYGLIVPDDKMRQHGDDGTAVAGTDDDNGLRGDDSVDDDPSKQGTSGGDDRDDNSDDLYDD
jgi:hypothetical protein